MKIRSWMVGGATIMGVALMLAACGGGNTSQNMSRPVLNATLPASGAKSGAKPNPDGFAFPNFGAAATSVEFDASDMATMFAASSEICVEMKGPCELSAEARAWARMVNQARVAGHCEGLAVLASSRFISNEEPKTITLPHEEDLTHAIMRAFATQFLDETQEATKTWAKKRPSEIVAALVDSLQQGAPSFTLGVYTDSGGHAVLPYAVEFPSSDVARIMVYDSNWPGMDRYVEVNLTDESWQFSFSGVDPAVDPQPWTGGEGDLDITPLDARINGACPFCESETRVQKSLLLIRSAKPDWSIQSVDGELTPGSQLVGESVVRPLRSALPPRPIVIDASRQGPTDYLVFTNLSGKGISLRLGSTTRIVGVTPKAIFEIDAQSDSLSVDVTVSEEQVAVDDPNVGLTLSNENYVASSAGDENTISLGDGGIAVDLVTEDGTAIRFETSESARAIDVRTGSAADATEGAKYEVFTQVSDSEVEHLVVTDDDAKSITRQQGQLENQKTSVELPEQLDAPIVKAGLPPSEVREFTGTPEVSGTTVETTTTISPTTTVVPTTTTVIPATTTTTIPATTTTTTIPVAPTQAPSEEAILALPLVEPGKPLQASSVIAPGGEVSVTYTGLTPGQWTQLVVASTPQVLDTALADGSGSISLSGKLPATLAPGNHHLAVFQPQSRTGVRQLVTYTVPVVAPGAPTAIAATAGNAQAIVNWVAPSSNGGAPISSYLVTASPGVHSCISTSQSGTTPALSCTVVGLTNGRSYTFTVSASNSAGKSIESSASASVIPATTPSAPMSVVGVSGDSRATLSWTAPLQSGGTAITDYEVAYSAFSTGPFVIFNESVSTSTSAVVTGLMNGSTYFFKVAALNAVGVGEDSAISNGVTPAAVPGPPTSIVATRGNGEANISWAAPSANGASITSYTVTSTPGGFTCLWTSGPLTCDVQGLTNGTSYTFVVTATNSVGEGNPSAISQAIIPVAVSNEPTSVAGSSGNGTVSLTWTAPTSVGGSGIIDYVIEFSSNSGSSWSVYADGTSTATSTTVSGLTNGTSYVFRISALNSVGIGQVSNSSSSIIPATVPGAPTSVSGVSGASQVSVSWNAPVSNGGASVSSYVVTASPGGQTCNWSAGALSCVVSGLSNGVEYTFSVVAGNSVGVGPSSNASSAVTPLGSAPVLGSVSTGNGQITFAWGGVAHGGDTYRVFWGTDPTWASAYTYTSSGGATSYTATGLTNGTTYYFKVAGWNNSASPQVGTTPWSANGSAVPSTTPSAPTISAITSSDASLSVAFTAGSSGGSAITSYKYSTDGGTTFRTRASGSVSSPLVITTLSTDGSTALVNGTSYSVQIKAVNANGDGVATASTVAAPATVPAAPSAISGTKGNGSLTLAWAEPLANGSSIIDYDVYVGASSSGPFSLLADAVSAVPGATVGGLTNATPYYFKVAAVSSLGAGATSPVSAAITPAAPCSSACAIGDVGPAGGIIFMTPSTVGNATGRYFESAPTGWSGDGIDLNISWCNKASTLIGTGTAIGTGSVNTDAIVAVCDVGAAKSARAYRGGGVSDWFLPSIDELLQMYANRAAIGGFVQTTQVGTGLSTTTYWSSSESNNVQARNWSFLTNGNDNWRKTYGFGVRPIRSFTTPSAPSSLAGVSGNGQVSLTWAAPSSDGGLSITDYVVQYSSNSGSSWTTFSDGTSTTLSAVVTGLTNGSDYVFQIAAVNLAGSGTYSSVSGIVSPSTTPSAPTISAITASNASLSVAFTAGSTGGSAITSYKYSTDGGSTFRTRTSGTTASPLVISTWSSDGTTALVNGTAYDIQIKAVNAIGDGIATSSTSATPRLPATAVAMTTQPVGAQSGAPLSTQPVVRIVDSAGNTVTTSTASVTVTASGGTLGGTTTVAAVNGVATFTNLTHATAGTYTLTFAASGLTSVTSENFTTDVDACATGGTCYVGNTGPGGGKVFYVSSSNFTSTGSACGAACQYLEAAPTGWITSSTPAGQTNCTTAGTTTADPGCEWSGNTSSVIGSTASAIGTGYANTTAIIAQSSGGNTAGKAATVARAYQGGGQADWHLPSLAEVNELCKYARNQTTGITTTTCTSAGSLRSGFTSGGFYWSSTEVNSVDALYRNFGNGGYAGRAKDQGWLLVRPVRAFSKASAVVVSTQPVGAQSGALLSTQPIVRIVDSAGNTVTTSTASVTVTASGGTLGGTTTVAAVNGVATFTDLTHAIAGSYTLTFATTSPITLTSATSASFTTAD